MKLVVAPRPQPTESLMGYVLRLTVLNGYPTPTYVLALLRSERYSLPVGRLDAVGLIQAAGVSRSDVDRLTHMPTDRSQGYIRVYRTDLPNLEVNLRHPKVCPACLAEGRPCEAFWDMAQAAVCPLHQAHLLTQCPGCNKNLLWSRPEVPTCKCGFDLRTATVTPANPDLVNLMAVMRHQVYRDEALAPFPAEMTHLAHLDLRRLCKLIWVLSGLVHQGHGGRWPPKSRCHYKPQMEIVASALMDWPFGFRSLLSELYDIGFEEVENLPSFRATFGWCFQRLIKNDEGNGSAFEFIEREGYLFGAQHWTRGAMVRGGGAKSLIHEKVRWGTLSEASEATGMHKMTLKKRIANGEIKTRKIKDRSNRAIVVDMDSIRERRATRHPAVSIRDAARQIGVSIEALKELRATGIFEDHYHCVYSGSLSKEDVDAFADKIWSLSQNRRAANTPGSVTLDAAFKEWIASAKEKAGLFARLIADPALVVGKKRGRGAGRLQVHQSTITDHFQEARVGGETCISVLKTAEIMGCSSNVVIWLKRRGYIKTIERHGRLKPVLASVIEFDMKYERIAKSAKRVGINIKAVYAKFNFEMFSHVKIGQPNRLAVFVLRKDLPKIEKILIALK